MNIDLRSGPLLTIDQSVRDVPGPYRLTPPPPPVENVFFDQRIARNLNGFNVMHFLPVDE